MDNTFLEIFSSYMILSLSLSLSAHAILQAVHLLHISTDTLPLKHKRPYMKRKHYLG